MGILYILFNEGDFLESLYFSAERHNYSTDEVYTFSQLCSDIDNIKNLYPDIPVFSIGKSFDGRDIVALKLGVGSKRLFFCGAHHGMEWLTAKVCIEFAKELVSYTDILHKFSIYIVPMVNPDGVEIASRGFKWQANARGVDLNHNYDALWQLSRITEIESGITSPCSSKYGGAYPESEPETKAVADFTRENNFNSVFALHSQGEVIYYDFCGIVPPETEEILTRIESSSRYLRELPSGTAVCGGYKDWFIKKFKRAGFTIEIGMGENPLPLSDFDNVYNEAKKVLFACLGK